MSRFLPDVLNALLSEGRFSAEDLGRMANCSANLIYKVRNEEADLSYTKAQQLSLALCREGETRVAATMHTPDLRLCTDGEARSNGSLDDEAGALFAAFGSAVVAFRDGDRNAVSASLAEAERALANARAERDRL